MTTRLTGREAELRALGVALRDGRDALITGGRGTGRSSLLAEAVDRHTEPGTTVLATAAVPGDGSLPGAGLQRLLQPVRPQTRALDAPAAAAFARLFGEDEPDGPAAGLPEAVRDLARHLYARGPLLWCVDDLDRLDPLSRDLIAGRAHGTVLATATAPVDLPGAHRIELNRLGPADAVALLAALPGLDGHPGARLVLAQSAGNPLALTELARHLPPAGEMSPTLTELPVPDRLRRALAPAVDRLDPVRRRAALLAAFAAETPGPAIATALGVLVSPDVWEWLATDHVLRPGHRRRFTHPVVRAAVIDRAGLAPSRDARHQLAALLPPGSPARAWHTARADRSADDRLAVTLDRAGSELLATGRLRAAAYALDMAARLSADPAEARGRRQRAVYSAHLAGERAWSEQLAGGAGDTGQVPVVEVPEIAPLVLQAWMRGDDQSRQAVRDVLGSGRPLADPVVSVWARAIVEDADPVGDVEQTLNSPGKLARRAAMSPDQREMVLGTIALARHQTTAAIRHMTRSAELAGPGSLNFPIAHSGLAGVRYDAGDLTIAVKHGEVALDATDGRATGPLADVRAGALAVLASVAALRESPDRDSRVHDMLVFIRPADQAAHDLRLVRAQGLIAGIRGRHELAFRRLRRLYHPDGRPVHHRISDLGLADLAGVAAALGRADEVRPLVEGAGTRIRELRSARTIAVQQRALALLEGPGETAETYFRMALADPATDVWAFERALTRLDYAVWLRRRQRPAESRPLLAAALEVFTEAGLTAWRERAEAELAAAAPPPRPGSDRVDRLTPQQRNVAVLAAQGLTNQQIGARLGLSARTVSTHLSRAYQILGVTRRSQLPPVMQ